MINKVEEKKKVLELLYKGNGLSRREINTVLQIRPTTLQEIISDFLSSELLHEPERSSKKTGAKSPKLFINPAYGNLLGIDLGSNFIKIVITDFNGTVLHKVKGDYKALKDRETLLNETFSIIDKIRSSKPRLWGKVKGIGISDPGPVDISNGISLFAYNIKHWANVPTVEIFQGKYSLPSAIVTASQGKALHEHFFSAAETKALFLVDMGHGIGAALIHNGELFTGFTNTEMEFGHILVNENGRLCACGKNGCLESETGSAAIIEKFKMKTSAGAQSIINDNKKITLQNIYNCYLANDPVSVAVVHEAAEYLAKGLSYIVHIVNPEKIILHGPVTILGNKIAERIKHNLYRYCFPSAADQTEILCSSSDEFSAASGACIHVRKTLLFS